MKLTGSPLEGVWLVEQERVVDERGFFARTYDAELLPAVVQMSTSFSASAGTLRGLHYQVEPHGESKLVRCTRGAIFDVVVDLRPDSPTRHDAFAIELSAEDGLALLVPEGFAHGFQTLADDTEVLYAMDTPYVPQAARGVRWDDPAFAIAWPEPPAGGRTISARDAGYAYIDQL
ncbi:dTDP-4-dehydrorhamnose 3,5-epimerase family protein [Aromatoleum sp.]|uniref:dTDP-4-dehydrorhamnose 3,5-epimerase family protein n=1 Tax=Aromatoleum sp. TaxID=2307007 RepID=UPI002FCAA33E